MKAPILTPRETEVLKLLKGGYQDKEISQITKRSVRAVQYTVGRLLAKFHVNSRAAFRLNIAAMNSKNDSEE